MSTEAMTLFFAMLAVAAEAMVAVAVLGSLAARVSPVARRLWRGVVDVLGPQGFGPGLAVAAAATAGSLYLSEVAHFPPCRLCWYQRAAMYPLVPLLGLASWRRWSRVRPWAAALAGAGACVSIYHVALQQFPSLGSTTCDPTNPCTLLWVEHFGYLTIPAMALSGFALIISLLLVSPRHERANPAARSRSETVSPPAPPSPPTERKHPCPVPPNDRSAAPRTAPRAAEPNRRKAVAPGSPCGCWASGPWWSSA